MRPLAPEPCAHAPFILRQSMQVLTYRNVVEIIIFIRVAKQFT